MNTKIEIDWSTWHSVDLTQSTGLLNQLKIEVGSAHLLFHLLEKLEFLAEDGASDDALVSNSEDHLSAYIVHLTWSKSTEASSGFPWTIKIPRANIPPEFI